MRKIAILLSLATLLCANTAAGQIPEGGERDDTTPPVNQRLFFGGSFGLQFGTVTNIQLSPLAGIWLMPRLAVGAGPSYIFYKYPYTEGTSIYGGRAMMQFTLVEDLGRVVPMGANTGIFARGEYELLNLNRSFLTGELLGERREWQGNFLVGGGISQRMGKKSSMNMLLLWCVTDNKLGLYASPEIRIEFYF